MSGSRRLGTMEVQRLEATSVWHVLILQSPNLGLSGATTREGAQQGPAITSNLRLVTSHHSAEYLLLEPDPGGARARVWVNHGPKGRP